jgi:arylsulfatase A-like enzyme
MSDSSRASIPPLSRPPAALGLEAPSLAQALWRRHLLMGGAVGVCLSLPALLRALSDGATGWQSAVFSAIFSGVLGALFVSAGAVSTFALFSLVRRLRKSALRASAVVGALFTCAYVALRGAAEAFQVSSGSAINLGTLEFVHASFSQLAGPVLLEYAPLALLLTALIVGFSWLVFVIARRPLDGSLRPWAVALRGAFSSFALVGLLFALTSPGLARASGLNKTADLALLASVAFRAEERIEVEEKARRLGVEVPRGARLSDGDLWQSAARHLEGPRPNVVLVMMESVGVDHLGMSGYERDITPSLDRISEKSRRFKNARTTATHSNYAQMAVLSSLFPRRYSGFDSYKRLDYPRFLWHDFLAAFGYSTATHSSQDEAWQGMLRFQTTHTKTEYHHSRTYEGQTVNMGAEKVVPDEVTVTRAIQWMEQADAPFGLYVNLQSTHFPYRVPPGAPEPFQPTRPTKGKFHYLNYPASDVPVVINRYDNALAYVDQQIGRLYAYLEKSGRLENTVLIVTSDHGESFGENGLVTHGRSLFEEEARVPLLVHFPQAVAPGDDFRLASTLDILPTLASLMAVLPHPSFQGTSLLGPPDKARPVFLNIQGMKSAEGVICGRFKFVSNRTAEAEALYNLEVDPRETKNLVASHPQVSDKLRTLLHAQMQTQVRYYAPRESTTRTTRYAPRFATCPDLEEDFVPDVENDSQTAVHAAAALN